MWRILIIESGEGLRVASERIKRAIKKGGKKSECYIMEIQVWVVSCKESMVLILQVRTGNYVWHLKATNDPMDWGLPGS